MWVSTQMIFKNRTQVSSFTTSFAHRVDTIFGFIYWVASELMNPKFCIQIVSTLYPRDGIGTEWGRCSLSHNNERKLILSTVYC